MKRHLVLPLLLTVASAGAQGPASAVRAPARSPAESAMRSLLESETKGARRRQELGPNPSAADLVATVAEQVAALSLIDLAGVPSDLRDDLAAVESGLCAVARILAGNPAVPATPEAANERLRLLGGILAQVQARTLYHAARAGVVLPEFGSCWTDGALLLFDDAVWLSPDPSASKAPAVQRLVNALAANADRQWFETLSPPPLREAALARERDAAFVEGLPADGLPGEVAEKLRNYVAALRGSAARLRAAAQGGEVAATFEEVREKESRAELSLWACAQSAGADAAALVERWRNGMTTGATRPPSAFGATQPGGHGAEMALKSLLMYETQLDRRIEAENALENPARAAELRREAVERIRSGHRTECPPAFLAALDAYLRSQEGIAATFEAFAAAESLPEPEKRDRQAILVWDIGHRAERLRDDRAALLREGRAAGARCKEAAEHWPQSAAIAAMERIAGVAAGAAPSPNPPVQAYLDRLSALFREAEAELDRAAGGGPGAKGRLDAMKALFLGLRGIDVSALPEDVRSAHAELVEGIRLAGTVMKRLADAAAQGPDAFERAATALEPEQRKVEAKLSAAGLLLRTAVVKAGLDSSAVPDGLF